MHQIRYRFANLEDAGLLAALNQQLIRDEGHRNSMDLGQLAERMSAWLRGEYEAILFENGGETIGYVLYRRELEFVYLRQLYVVPERRRQGVARDALCWLWQNAWAGVPRLRIEVLAGNVAGRAFWKSVGLQEYAITMEALPPTND
jgi:GNAT superfamily N-acetyltransferase